MLSRGLQYTYLTFITQQAAHSPELETGKELIDSGILTHIPTIQTQSGMTVYKKNGIWNYISSP